MHYENIIIGAGPAGLQLGYFFKRANINYVILEKAPAAASFFSQFPHSGKLISINKKYTGTTDTEFNLRHDWNSLLSDEKHLFTDYSEEYYPDHTDLVRYLNDFATKYELNIVYNTTVLKVKKGTNKYTLFTPDASVSSYTCNKLIIATGLSKARVPREIINNTQTHIKHYGEFEKDYFKKKENLDKYRNKSLLIIGNGNAAYELGNLLNPICSSIGIAGKNPKPWAMSTHYTGDLRAVYLPLYDTFLLKSLNGFDYTAEKFVIDQETPESRYTISFRCNNPNCTTNHPYIPESRAAWDHVILSTGWAFDDSIFDFDVELTKPAKKYPVINSSYESVNNKHLYFIGSLMHVLDFKKSSGGFIHGFRYLIKYFFNLIYDRKFDVERIKLLPPPATATATATATYENIVEHIVFKINNSSALYQMYGEMCDIFYKDPVKGDFIYFNNVHKNFFATNGGWPDTNIFILTLEYGMKEPVTDIYKFGRRITDLGTESDATLLHPVIRVYEAQSKFPLDTVHFDEDLFANFISKDKYADKIARTIHMFV